MTSATPMSTCGHPSRGADLARTGFVAAAVSHAGETVDEESGLSVAAPSRPASRLVDYMLDEWPKHEGWMQPTSARSASPTAASPCSWPRAGGSQTFRKSPIARRTHHDRCQVPKHTGVDAHLGADVPAGAWVSEPHIKAMVIAAAFGFPFGHAG
jgi:hypothetical protein